MPKKKPDTALMQPIAPKQWQLQRMAERITEADRKELPHLNSTMRGTYVPKELSYRGQVR